jgi:hypothetical protein
MPKKLDNKPMIDINIYKQNIPTHFSENSKVWIYQCSRMLQMNEALSIEPILENFVANWQSHGVPVKGYANLFYGKFIIILADETQTTVGGCSTDSSVKIIKEIEKMYAVDFFSRQTLAFYSKEKIETLPLSQIKYALDNNFLTSETLYFNNLVTTKNELINNWITPIKNSWLAQRFELGN